jgi:hypothetical protein
MIASRAPPDGLDAQPARQLRGRHRRHARGQTSARRQLGQPHACGRPQAEVRRDRARPQAVRRHARRARGAERSEESFVAERTGALASRELAQEFGWQAGARLRFRTADSPRDIELTLPGIFDSKRHGFGRRASSSPSSWHILAFVLSEAAALGVLLGALAAGVPARGMMARDIVQGLRKLG